MRSKNSTCILRTLHSLLIKSYFLIIVDIQGFIFSCIFFTYILLVLLKLWLKYIFKSIITIESIFHWLHLIFNLYNVEYCMYYTFWLNRHHLAFVPFNFNMSFPLACIYKDHICLAISMCDLLSLAIICSSIPFIIELIVVWTHALHDYFLGSTHMFCEYAFYSFIFGSIFSNIELQL